jgi:putative ABC transport system permease protein
MWFSTFVLKNVFRRKVRSGLTGVGVAVAVGAVVALFNLSEGFERSFAELYEVRGIDIVVLQAGKTERLTSDLDQKLSDRLAEVPGVASVSYAVVDMVSFEDYGLIGVPVVGWPSGSMLYEALQIRQGRQLTSEDRRGVMLGSVLAKNLGKSVGDALELEGDTFQVVGLFQSFNIYENNTAVILLDTIQDLLNRRGRVSGFMIVASSDADKPRLVQRICDDIEALKTPLGRSLGLAAMPTRDYTATTLQIRMARATAWMTSAIALVIGTVGMLNTMIMSVFERTKEIGILRAIGWKQRRVVGMILMESLTLSLTGAILGSAGAALLTHLLSRLPIASGYVQGNVAPGTVALGFAIAVLLGLLGGAYPAVRGARLLPTEALRHE